MLILRKMALVALLMAGLVLVPAAMAQDQPNLDELFAYLKTYKFGESREPLTRLTAAVRAANGDAAKAAELERRFDEILQGDAGLDAKRYTSRELNAIGTAASVPALAALLADDTTYDFATKTLEVIRGQEALNALSEAAQKLQGRQQLGAVQALGRLGNAAALPALEKLASGEGDIPGEAILAIGKIGGQPALETLEQIRPNATEALAPALRNAYLMVAEGLGTDGNAEIARQIYTELYKPDHPSNIRAAALGGLVAISPQHALETVSTALNDADPEVAHLAIGYMREIPGPEATAKFASLLQGAQPENQMILLDALAQRGDAAARDAVAQILASPANQQVLESAIKSIGKLGDASNVPALLQAASVSPGDAPRLAKGALVSLPGEGVNQALMAAAREQKPTANDALSALGDRGAADVKGELLALAAQGTPEQKAGALKAVQSAVAPEDVAALLEIQKTSEEAVRKEAERVLLGLVQRTRPAQQVLDPVLAAYQAAQDKDAKIGLLNVVANASGEPAALEAIRAALSAEMPAVRIAAVRALGNWKGVETLEDLLKVAQSAKNPDEQAEGLNQYLKVLRENSAAMGDQDLLKRYEEALALATSAQQKKRILSALTDVHAQGVYALIDQLAADAELKADATLATLKVAQALGGAYPQDSLTRLEPIITQTQDENLRNQANAAKDAINRSAGYITAWEYAGPYAEESKRASALFQMQFPPESAPDTVPWKIVPLALNPQLPYAVALDKLFPVSERVVYLRTTVTSAKAQDAVLELGTNDGCKVWLNGEQIHAVDLGRPLIEGQDKVKVSLKEGANVLLIAVYQQGGEWGAIAKLTAPDGQPLADVSAAIAGAASAEDEQWEALPTGTLSGQQVL